MSAMEITRLFGKIVRLGESAENLLDRILKLEARVVELETREALRTGLEQSARGQVKYLGSFEIPPDPTSYPVDPDHLIVERWKAGGCISCERRRGLYLHYCDICHFGYFSSNEVEEMSRLQALCDAAVKGGK